MKKIIATALFLALCFSAASMASAQHIVTKGQTLYGISKQYNMSLKDLISLNPHIKDPNQIRVNDYIVIRSQTNKKQDLVDYAKSLQYVTAYKYGGQQAPTSTDCSGWTQYIYKKFGVTLPRTSAEQSKTGKPVTFSQLSVGDLMFFSTDPNKKITHVGIFMGNDMFISNLNEVKDVEILPSWGKWSRDYFMWGSRYEM